MPPTDPASLNAPAGRVLLKDNRDLTPAEFERALAIRRAVVSLVETREEYIHRHGLDRDFALPSANWGHDAHNDFCDAYRHVRDGDYAVVNRLRFFSQCFTGYQIMTLRDSGGHPSVNPIPPDFDEWIVKHWPWKDPWVERWVNIIQTLPAALVWSPPRLLGEIGTQINGIVVNHDTYVYQERINLLNDMGVLAALQTLIAQRGHVRVLEIGGGYGALALALQRVLGHCSYTICDLPESLMFSATYLALTGPRDRDYRVYADGDGWEERPPSRTFMPNYAFTRMVESGSSFDLVINTLSLSEMSPHQITTYGRGVSRLIGADGLFFEQNQDNRCVGLSNCKDYLAGLFVSRHDAPPTCIQTQGFPTVWSNRPGG